MDVSICMLEISLRSTDTCSFKPGFSSWRFFASSSCARATARSSSSLSSACEAASAFSFVLLSSTTSAREAFKSLSAFSQAAERELTLWFKPSMVFIACWCLSCQSCSLRTANSSSLRALANSAVKCSLFARNSAIASCWSPPPCSPARVGLSNPSNMLDVTSSAISSTSPAMPSEPWTVEMFEAGTDKGRPCWPDVSGLVAISLGLILVATRATVA
mmetsp:Transcript_40165/g.110415  ORF Transcript_40165/g.110415 Transcript_40165/m.110415 type:complete len:217 (-) Transcript_40165:3-653(-)